MPDFGPENLAILYEALDQPLGFDMANESGRLERHLDRIHGNRDARVTGRTGEVVVHPLHGDIGPGEVASLNEFAQLFAPRLRQTSLVVRPTVVGTRHFLFDHLSCGLDPVQRLSGHGTLRMPL